MQDGAPSPTYSRACPTCGRRFRDSHTVCPDDETPLGERTPDDPLVGEIVASSYRLLRVIARGGMGRLYEAEHTRLRSRVVVKVVHAHYAHDDGAVARFEREALAASRVRSRHVVAVLDVARVHDGRPCMVTEKLDGEDLKSRLDRDPTLPIADALRIAREVCAGLKAAHTRQVIHRDLKPSNVFLCEEAGQVHIKLLDFGVAKLMDAADLTQTGAVVGTPAYMPPEQAVGSKSVSVRADVYGVGAILYRMLTGHAPYVAGTAAGTLGKLLHEAPTPARAYNPSLDERVVAVMERAMARDAQDRFPDVFALDAALARVTEERSAERLTRRAPASSDAPRAELSPGAFVGLLIAAGTSAGIAVAERGPLPLDTGFRVGSVVAAFAAVLLAFMATSRLRGRSLRAAVVSFLVCFASLDLLARAGGVWLDAALGATATLTIAIALVAGALGYWGEESRGQTRKRTVSGGDGTRARRSRETPRRTARTQARRRGR